MFKKISLLTIVITILPFFGWGLASHAQTSPNGRIKVEFHNDNMVILYKTGKTWQSIMEMPGGFTEEFNHTCNNKVTTVDYRMSLGKKSHCTNAYREVEISIKNQLGRVIPRTLRLYNDGIAWKDSCHDNIIKFKSPKNNWLMKWTDSYEGFFPKNREIEKQLHVGYPALLEFDNNIFALLSESCMIKESAGTSLRPIASDTYMLQTAEGGEPGWQTLIIGSLAQVVESTLITDNSESQKVTFPGIESASGVASWIYWANNHGSNDFSIIKKYVDMAVELKMPYVLIDAEWDEMDKLDSNEGKTIEDAVRYATDNGIKPIIWYNSSVGWINGAPGPKFRLNKPEDMEKEFAWCEKIGVKGVKIDFFSGDTNLNIKYMIELLECAAKHGLLVNFHGATIPRGWQRTYPNLVSTEGVYGAEWYNNVPTFTDKAAAHNATLPFTRNVIGSMDYTPCAFSDSQHPHITTHAHELALTVLFESGIQHIADRPESLLAQPKEVKDFFGELPTAWDETRLLSGYPGEYVVMARRKGTTWYVAGINGTDEEKTIAFPDVTKLKKQGKYKTIFTDGSKDNPWSIIKDNFKKDVPVLMKCQPRGGFVMKITH